MKYILSLMLNIFEVNNDKLPEKATTWEKNSNKYITMSTLTLDSSTNLVTTTISI